MLSQIALAALSILPIGKVLAAHPLLSPSLVFYFDQIPTEVYDDDPDVVAHKDVVYIRKDIHQLDPEDGPSLTCLPNGQVQLGYTNESALELNKLAYTQLLGHPVRFFHPILVFDLGGYGFLTSSILHIQTKALLPQGKSLIQYDTGLDSTWLR